MSAHRSFARLPSGIFHDLIVTDADHSSNNNDVENLGSNHVGGGGGREGCQEAGRDPERLRAALCSKLLRYFTAQTRAGSGRVQGPTVGCGPPLIGPASGPPAPAPAVSQVTAVQLLRMSPPAVLRALSPLLTAEECDELVRRVCDVCATRPSTALTILRQTHSIGERRQRRRQRRRPLRGDGDYTDTTPGNVWDADVDAETDSNEAFDNDRMRHLPSGTPKLDDCLRGGFRVGTVTELCGRAGVGKTQLCLQLCVSAARYGQGSVYVDSERKLSLRRLQEIASRRWEETRDNGIAAHDVGDEDGFQYGNDPGDGEDGPHDHGNHRAKRRRRDLATRADEDGLDAPPPYRTPRDVLENVTVHTPNTTDEMLSVVSGLEEEILLRNDAAASGNPSSTTLPVRLVVLDSIAAPTKRDLMGGGPDSARRRVATIFRTAQMLKRLADQLRVAVVVVNQVGLLADGGGAGPGPETTADVGTDYVSVSASLGTSWHHCVTTRLLLEHERDPHRERTDADVAQEAANANVAATRDGGGHNGDDRATERRAWMAERGRVRRATVRKSNVAGRASMFYEVTALGVCEI